MLVKIKFCVLAYKMIIGIAEITAAAKYTGLEFSAYLESVLYM